ncbi:MAG: OadG family protein [Clostridia bacterium]|nr:OadG family protein [Clostridia bacterium]
MFDFLLANVKPEATVPLDSLWEKFTIGGSVFVRGMCTVFAVLAIIWLFLVIVRYFVYDLPNKRKAEATSEPKAKPAPQATPAATPMAPVSAAPAAVADDELIAVIAAAIAAATAESGGGKFRVVSFHRVNK